MSELPVEVWPFYIQYLPFLGLKIILKPPKTSFRSSIFEQLFAYLVSAHLEVVPVLYD
jgi:hypothetical protein